MIGLKTLKFLAPLSIFVNREDSLMSKRIVMRTEQPTKCHYHISYGG